MATTSFNPFSFPSQIQQQTNTTDACWPWIPKEAPKTPRKPLSASNSQTLKTPKKTPKKTPGHDRFIPCIDELDLEMSHFNLLQKEEEEVSSPGGYKDTLANTLFDGKLNGKILKFKDKAPIPQHQTVSSSLQALYMYSHADKPKKQHRHVPLQPERILDAPEIRDDFYLNLLDWGGQGVSIILGNSVYIWNTETCSISQLPVPVPDGNDEYLTSLSWSRNSEYLALGTHDGHIQLWDVRAEKRVRTLRGHRARVGSLSWNDPVISSGSRDALVINHDVRQAQGASVLYGHTQEVCGLKWSADGTQLASGANDNLINVWDFTATNNPRFVFNDHNAAVKALAWCPWERNLLASGGGTADRCIRFWNTSTGAMLNSVDTHSQVCALLWSKHSKELVSAHGYSMNQLSLWRYPSMDKIADLPGHTNRILNMAMSPDGESVCSIAGDETLRFWKLFEKPSSIRKFDTKTAAKSLCAVTIR